MRPVSLGAIAGSGGGGGYIAPAVHFDGATTLKCASLTATDNTSLSCSFWIKLYQQDTSQPPAYGPYNTVWVVDPEDTYPSWGEFGTDVDVSGLDYELIAFVSNGGTGVNNVALLHNPNTYDGFVAGEWYNCMYVLRSLVDDPTQDKEVVLYVNDVLTSHYRVESGDVTFNMLWNGLPFWVGNDGLERGGLVADLADFWFAPGVDISTGTSNITIPEATRRLFIDADGKPVDPSGFPASAVLLSGNASTFATNQGSGGTFATTGALTNASSSPSD